MSEIEKSETSEINGLTKEKGISRKRGRDVSSDNMRGRQVSRGTYIW